ncbi:MAG: hypothetical protein IJC30_03195 [Alphaproteobacteria bacterium]|nr:hypothetical protein [Alphaproteobacteria bacterium]
MQVISLTDGKISQTSIDGRDIIIKKSSFNEVKKIEEARHILKNHTIRINGDEFNFHLPKIYDYVDGKIYMERLTGDNLEIGLRTAQNREKFVETTNSLFQYLYDNKIYWGDFAPRNIIIDTNKHSIGLCDFERGIQHNVFGKDFLQNYAYEEYGAFLLPSERSFSEKISAIFSVDKKHTITMDDIKSNRVKSIIRAQHIPQDSLTNQTIANVNKMIVLAETPYRLNKEIIFPIVRLEQIKDRSYALFAKEICSVLAKRGPQNGNDGKV